MLKKVHKIKTTIADVHWLAALRLVIAQLNAPTNHFAERK